MKVVSVCGISGSGKTTTIENIISELCRRGYKVGSVKDIHFEQFTIDPVETSNTNRHRRAGASLVTARGLFETDILHQSRLSVEEIIDIYDGKYDWLVLEGVDDAPIPTIVTAHTHEDLKDKWSDMAFAVSGRLSAEIDEYMGKPAIDATTNIGELVDLIELKVYDRLPNFPPECCGACGMPSCGDFAEAVIAGQRHRKECVANKGIELHINGKRIQMVPFVQQILTNAVLGVASELIGYEKGCDIEIKLTNHHLSEQAKYSAADK
ncbi:MAG: molybdopterin-guanine dinucleotide biosynthesis protein MobB [Defluviitaleaceae bacterium]|nr:molybdopterin-guanine dinucleotide biosynthesis protein MobB [Defluviitaleaceae bacterium]